MKYLYRFNSLAAILLITCNLAAQPYIGGYNVYYGSLHNHSDVSDGIGTPDEAYNYAKNITHLDFFGLTDHSDLIQGTEWTAMKTAADAYNEPGVFTSFRGFEWTTYPYGHVTVVNSEDYSSSEPPVFNFTDLCDWLDNRECIAFFNHPGYANAEEMEFFHFLTTPNRKIVGMELWTSVRDFSNYYYSDGYFPNDGNKGYFDEALLRNWKIGALGSEDNHFGTWGNLTNSRMAVLANANTREDIYSAIKAKRFYSTLDKNLGLSFQVNGNEMGSTVVPGIYGVVIQASDADGELFTQIQLLKNGEVVNTWTPNSATPEITMNISFANNEYYYIRVRQEDNDEAISSPIWISAGNQFPFAAIINPLTNDVFNSHANIAFDVAATDADGTISQVEFYEGSTLLGTDNTRPYSFIWMDVAAGNYIITAKATDNQGVSVISAPISIVVGDVSNQSPVVSITSPQSGATFTAPGSFTITATASDPDGTIAKVEFYYEGYLVMSDKTSPYTFIGSNIPVGDYTITAKATDNNGSSTTSSPITIHVIEPNEPPSVSISAPETGSTFPSPAFIVIDATATDADGSIAKVDFYKGDSLLGTDHLYPYSFAWADVTTGVYTITAKATDNLGVVSVSAPVGITVGVVPNQFPVVSISSPVSGTIFTAPASIVVEATAADSDGMIKKVDFYQGDTLLGTDTISPYSINWTDVSVGSYMLTAVATDDEASTTTSNPINIVVVSNQPPVVTITGPSGGAIFTTPVSVFMQVSATDFDGTIKKVDFYQGDILLGTDTISPYSFTWTGVAAGSYTIKAIATDNAGDSITSAPVSITVVAPNVPPVVSITAPLPETVFTAPTSLTIDAIATDDDGIIARVDFYQGSTLLGWDISSPYSFTWTDVAIGSYTITARASDNHGALVTSAPVVISVNAPNIPPVVSITGPLPGVLFTSPASITIDATATDADGIITRVDFYNGETLLGSDITNSYSFTWTGVAAGSYILKAVATDNSGDSVTSVPVSITVVAPNVPPVISIIAPLPGAQFTAPALVTINVTATDSDGTIKKVDFYQGDVFLGTDTISPYSFTWTGVAAGSYTIKAVATDNSGDSITSTPVSITVVAPNVPPVVSVTAPLPGSQFTAPALVTINATATDSDGTIIKVDFYQGDVFLGTDTISPYSFIWTGVAVGSYTIKVVATDNAGDSITSAPVTITVVAPNVPPVVSVTAPLPGSQFTAPALISIDASATDEDGTIRKVDFYQGDVLLGTDTISPYSFTWTGVAVGSYTIKAVATDNAGDSITSAPVSITVVAPNVPPVVSITAPLPGAQFTAPAMVTIDASATDEDGTIRKVDFYQGDVFLGTDTISPYSFAWTGVAPGSYTIKVVATDNSGDSLTSAPVSITVVAPNVPPVVSIIAPLPGAQFTVPALVTINATATDSDGTIRKVDFYQGDVFLGTDTISPYSFTWTGVAPGNYALKAIATDNSGDSIISVPVSITVVAPNVPPVVSITAPLPGAQFTAPALVSINASATDEDGTITNVDFYNGEILLGTDTISPYSFPWTGVAPGSYAIKAVATDNSGDSITSAPVTITVIAPNVPPVVSITAPLPGAQFIAPALVTINATATDSDGTIKKVDFYQGDVFLGTDTISPYSFTWTGVAVGSYTIKVVATDNSGDSITSTPVTITVVAPNVPPVISITAPLPGAQFTAPATVTINASATDEDGTIRKVDFYQGDTFLGTDTISPYSFTWTGVAVGSYTIKAIATDNSGDSITSTPVTITVVAPNVPPVVSITAPLPGAQFTAPAMVTINVTATDSDGTIRKVDFYQGDVLLGTDTISPYSFTWTGVAVGSYTIKAVATDNAGDSITSAPVSITVVAPNVPPVVSITAPLPGAQFTAPAMVTINVTATDSDGTIRKVDFYQGDVLLGTDTISPYSFTWTGVAVGSYTIKAVATDNAGDSITSAPVSITVVALNVPPVVSITAPLPGAQFTAPALISINATATDSDGTIRKVDFYQGDVLLGTDTISPYSFTWTGVAVGSYTIKAVATDNAGDSITSAPVSITVVAPNIPPVVSITAPLPGAQFTAPAMVTINASANDSDGTIRKVDFYQGNTFIGTDSISPYSFTWTSVTPGSYTIKAVATDNAGDSIISAPVTITVVAPNVPPVVSITAPLPGAQFTAPALVTINATAVDSDGTITKVDFYQGNTFIGTDSISPYSFTWTSVTPGSYTIKAVATDNAGDSIISAPVTITVVAPNVPPVVSITAPLPGVLFTSPASITIDATATDADGTITKVDFYQRDILLGTDTISPYSFDWTGVAVGSYTIKVVATDNAGDSITSAPVTITVVAPNVPPVVSITAPLPGAQFTAPAMVTINASANDSDGTIRKVDFYQGDIYLGTDTISPYSFPWTGVAPGSYAIKAVATDNSGDSITSAPVTITVVAPNVPPVVSITAPLPGAQFTAPATVTINAPATDEDGTIRKVDFYQGNTFIGTDSISPYSFTWTSVTPGSYTIKAVATDNAGDSIISAPVTITVVAPNVPPVVSITAPLPGVLFTSPASITIDATATDADGTITKVDFYQRDILLGTDTISPYSFTWTGVAVGSYTIKAVATDNAGDSITSAPVSITVVAPNVPPVVSITAPLPGAQFTAPALVIINATAVDSDGTIRKVDFYQGDTFLGTDTISPYSFTWTGVAVGSYTIKAVATDNAGDSITSAPVSITVVAPNVPPVVSITAPLPGAQFTAPAMVTINASATDSDGTIRKVDFYQGDVLLGTDTISPYSFAWTSVTPGSYTIKAVATDNAGDSVTSAPVTITVVAPNIPPVVSITAPLPGAQFTAPALISINAPATDEDGTIRKVDFYQGDILLGTDTISPYSFAWTGVAPRNYTIKAVATDNSGDSITSTPVSITVVAPNVPPVVSVTAPLPGSQFTAPALVTINASATDVDGTIKKVDFYQGDVLLGTDTISPYSFAWTGVAPGSYTIKAIATDNSGDSITSTPVTITVVAPNVPPVVSITAPLPGAQFTAPAMVTINVTATDSDGTIRKVDFYQGDVLLGTDTISPYSFTWTSVTPGSYTIKAIATDNASDSITSAPVTITVVAPNVPPVVSITNPLPGAQFTAPALVTINASANDSDGTIRKVDFYQGDVLLGTDTISPYSFTWTGVAVGSYTIKVVATDNSGDSITSTPVSITVVAPNVPPVVSITAPLPGAQFTAPALVTINASATDSDGTIKKVDFYQGDIFLGTDTISPYSFAWTSVTPGSYTIKVVATDNSGDSITSSPVSITVVAPNVPPVVSITNPLPGAQFTVPALVIINATAVDSDGTIRKVDFYQGDTFLGTDTISPYSFTWTGVAPGNYTIKAVATDNAGDSITSTPVTITVVAPNVPPVVSITAPLPGAQFTAPAMVTINVTATDSDGTIRKVDFYQGDVLLGTDTISPYSFTWTGVAVGSYTIKAIATDNAGDSITSAPVTITVVAPNVPPVVSITAPLPGAQFTAPATVTINASANDSDGTIRKVDFYQGDIYLGTDTISPYSFPWTGVAPGSYAIKAVATDNSGDSITSAPVTITVVAPNVPPVVSITAPLPGAQFTAPATVTINAPATDEDGTIRKVDFYQGDVLLGTDTISPYSFAWTGVAPGNYTIKAVATDNAGDSITSAPVLITVVAPNIPPVVSITAPLPGAQFTAPATVTINASANDSDGTIRKVDFYQGDVLLGTDTISPYSFTWTGVAVGSYTIKAIATDNAGDSITSAPVTITVVAPNVPPVVSITAPLPGAQFTAPALVTINASANDSDGTIKKVDFYQGDIYLGTDTISPYSFAWTGVAPGSYTIKVVATDNSGDSITSTPVTITVVAPNVPPVVSITAPLPGAQFTAPAMVTINVTATDSDGTIRKVDFYQGDIYLGTDTISPYSFPWTGVAPGSYAIKAVATDNSGDSITSTPVTITVVAPNVPPVVSITNPLPGAQFTAPALISINAPATDEDGTIKKVDFYQGDVLLGTDTISPYSFAWAGVAAGSYTLTAKATDNMGALINSAPVNITVAATNHPPVVNLTSPVHDAVFSAPATITLTASATDSDGTISKVDFYYGGSLLLSDNTSPYSYIRTNVPVGSYTITAKATDNNGATTTSSAVTFTVVSNQSPVVTLTSPLPGATFTPPAFVALTALASDADGTVTKVDFYQGSTMVGSDNTSPYSFNWTNVTTGIYSLTARATDNVGVISISAPISITVGVVSNQPPVVNLTSPVQGAVFSAPATVTLTALATDSDGTISKVEFYYGGTLPISDDTSPYSYTGTNIPVGTYTITAKATDNNGATTTSNAVTFTVVSNQSPVVTLTSPLPGATFTSPATVSLNASASDADGTVTKVDFYQGSTMVGSDNTNPYSFNWTNVTTGIYTLTARATDNMGALTTSAPININVGGATNQPPIISFTSPLSGAVFTGPAYIEFIASASDADGTIAKVDFYYGGTLLLSDNSAPYSYNRGGIPDGNYTITALATDNIGATTSTTVAIGVVDNQSPVVNIASPAAGAIFTIPASVTIDVAASDPDGTIVRVEFYQGSTLLGSDNSSPYSFNWTNAAEGSYMITAKAIDNQGALTTSAGVSITINSLKSAVLDNPVIETTAKSGNLECYPVPFTNELHIDLYPREGERITVVEIVNSIGKRMIYEMHNQNQIVMDLQHLKPGVYIVRVRTNMGLYNKLVIKN